MNRSQSHVLFGTNTNYQQTDPNICKPLDGKACTAIYVPSGRAKRRWCVVQSVRRLTTIQHTYNNFETLAVQRNSLHCQRKNVCVNWLNQSHITDIHQTEKTSSLAKSESLLEKYFYFMHIDLKSPYCNVLDKWELTVLFRNPRYVHAASRMTFT
jgi:regulatory protein YycI of two-component signal transduction system YycFG